MIVVHSDRPKRDNLNPMSDSRIRPRSGFTDGGDGVWVCILFYTGFQRDLRSFYKLSILPLLSYLSFTSGLSFFLLLKWSGLGRVSMVWVRKVTTKGVGWASEEASDLVAPPLNLVLYMQVLFVHRPCVRNKADLFYLPVLSLYHRTYGAPEGWVLVLGCTLDPDEVSFADVGHPFVFQNTKGPDRIAHGWEDRYSVRPHPTETFLHDCLFWDLLFDSSIFSRREGASHLTGSCLVPYRLLCQVQVLYILEFGCNFIPYTLEAFLAWDTQKLPFWSR